MKRHLTIAVADITGSPSPKTGGWSTCLKSEPAAEDIRRLKGNLYSVASIKVKVGFDAQAALQTLFQTLEQSYFQSGHTSVLKALEEACLQAQRKLLSIVQEKERLAEGLMFDLVAAVVWGNVLYIGQMGLCRAGLWRAGLFKFIGQGEEGGHIDGQGSLAAVKMASGLIRKDDVLILATPALFSALPEAMLLPAMQSGVVEKGAADLQTKIRGTDNDFLMQGLLLKFQFTVLPTSEEVIKIISPSVERFRRIRLPLFSGQKLPASFTDTIQPLFSRGINAVRFVLTRITSAGKKMVTIIQSRLTKLPSPQTLPAIQSSVEEARPPLSRKALALAALLFILLLGSIGATRYFKNRAATKSAVAEKLSAFNQNLEDAGRVSFPLVERMAKFDESENILSDIRSGLTKNELAEAEAKLTDARDVLYAVTRLDNPTVFSDLSSRASDTPPQELAGQAAELYLLSGDGKKVYRVNSVSGTVEALEPPDTGFEKLCADETNLFGFSKSSGVWKLSGTDFTGIIDSDSAWGDITSVTTYSGNIYLLDTLERQIDKYIPAGDGFSSRLPYLREPIDSSRGTVVSLSIDGSVYVLGSDGSIGKYISGGAKPFDITGLDAPMSEAKKLFTSEELKYLYVLDKAGKRVVVLSKTGEYQKQYVSQKWENPAGLFVEPTEKTLFILSGSFLYSVSLP